MDTEMNMRGSRGPDGGCLLAAVVVFALLGAAAQLA